MAGRPSLPHTLCVCPCACCQAQPARRRRSPGRSPAAETEPPTPYPPPRVCLDARAAGDLRKALGRVRGKGAPEDFEIRSAFPPAAYGDAGQTLQQAGLVPNAALLLVARGGGPGARGGGGR